MNIDGYKELNELRSVKNIKIKTRSHTNHFNPVSKRQERIRKRMLQAAMNEIHYMAT